MPKKFETSEETVQAEQPKQPYFFPTIGEGVTVLASSQQEANDLAAKLKKDFSSISPQI